MKRNILKAFLFLTLLMPMSRVLAYSKFDCGNATQLPVKIADIVRIIVLVIEILTPIILVILGSIDLFKAMSAGKEDEIKKAQGLFVKRLITGVIIFFIIAGVKFVVSLVGDDEDIVTCIDYFTNGVPKDKQY